MNSPFALLGLPETFRQDDRLITERYRTLAARFHPDRFAAASAFEQKQAVMMAAALNQAYETVKHPLNRAAALLSQQGIDADAPEHTSFAPDFLMQQMQWREMLDDARENAAALNHLDNQIAAEQNILYTHLQQQFDEGCLNEAAQTVRKGRFLDKLRREIAACSV